jgi:hypothetical protein
MTIALSFLPDWLPGWVPIALLVPGLLYLLAFLFMPFSVIGLKARIEGLEGRLDELQNDLRTLVLRLPEPVRGGGAEDFSLYAGPGRGPPPPIPPVPRPVMVPRAAPLDPTLPPLRPPRGERERGEEERGAMRRSEPRLDWPR